MCSVDPNTAQMLKADGRGSTWDFEIKNKTWSSPLYNKGLVCFSKPVLSPAARSPRCSPCEVGYKKPFEALSSRQNAHLLAPFPRCLQEQSIILTTLPLGSLRDPLRIEK